MDRTPSDDVARGMTNLTEGAMHRVRTLRSLAGRAQIPYAGFLPKLADRDERPRDRATMCQKVGGFASEVQPKTMVGAYGACPARRTSVEDPKVDSHHREPTTQGDGSTHTAVHGGFSLRRRSSQAREWLAEVPPAYAEPLCRALTRVFEEVQFSSPTAADRKSVV